jgi:type III pantothenate kinase
MKKQRILLVDVGNTSISLGLGCGQRISRVSHVPTRGRSESAIRNMARAVAGEAGADGAIISSVVPRLTPRWKRALRTVCGRTPIVVTSKLKLDITIDYPRPASIGGDRIADTCGAVAKYGAPVIIADFGTALTFDVVTRDRRYVGGAIVPGLPFMTDYLADRTALLPKIKLRAGRHPIGRNTSEAMQIGARVGYRGMVREMFTHLRKNIDGKPHLCATGGHAAWVLDGLNMNISLDPNLTLYGLARIHELNK